MSGSLKEALLPKYADITANLLSGPIKHLVHVLNSSQNKKDFTLLANLALEMHKS
jgi:hypothetical protein